MRLSDREQGVLGELINSWNWLNIQHTGAVFHAAFTAIFYKLEIPSGAPPTRYVTRYTDPFLVQIVNWTIYINK
jgi:hypothetical protein